MKLNISGKIVEAQITGINGLCLVGSYQNPDGSVFNGLIGNVQALSQEEYWKLWRELGGDKLGLRFSDGTPFDPTK